MVSSMSVIIPAFNCEATLGEQLDSLVDQTYRGSFEVLVVDNRSTDRTARVAESYGDRLDMSVVSAESKQGASHARNVGAAAAKYDHLAFCDADDVAAQTWLEAMASALDSHDFVTGSIDHDSLNPDAASTHFRSHVEGLPTALHFLPYALSGNMAITKFAFEQVSGFPEDLNAVGEDVALSWDLQLAGYELAFEPKAVVAYRHRSDLRSLWSQHVSFGIADAVLYKRFRDRGMPSPTLRSTVAGYLRLVRKIPYLFHRQRRASWIRSAAKRWGRIRGSLREMVVYL